MPIRRETGVEVDRPSELEIRPVIKWNALTLKIGISVLIGAMALGLPFAGETREKSVLDRADIDISYADLNKLIKELSGTATTAEAALADVKNMKIEEAKEAINDFYEDMKVKVNQALERLAPNSVLMDNLEGAKSKMIVLQRWFERQPPDYPNRDQLVMRVAGVVEGYEESTGVILSGRKDAQDALRQLMRAQFYQGMEAKVETAEFSVEATRRLVSSLQALSDKIGKLAAQEKQTPGISN